MSSKSEMIAADVAALLRARNPLLWVVTREEGRAERHLFEAAAAAGYVARTWDVAQGIANIGGQVEMADRADPDSALEEIHARATGTRRADRGVWIMRDLGPWLSGNVGIKTQRLMRNLARMLPGVPLDRAQAIIVLSAGGDVPAELVGHATVIDWPLPDRSEIADILDAAVESLPDELKKKACTNGSRDAAIDAAVGLSGEEAAACFARSLVQLRKIDPVAVATEKKRAIARGGVLQWNDPLPGGLDWVGGLENLKAWLKARATAYSPAARAYGIPAPRGVVVVGVSGCGKSLIAKAAAANWGVPLIRFDINAAKGKFVGQSEENIRKAFAQIDALGRCVVLIDEIEKAIGGATSASDGGVSTDALGALLTWMQERTGEAFVIATANDVSALPPEMLRKGRWDELFFVDLPNEAERVSVFAAALKQYKRDPKTVDVNLKLVASETEGFSGAEIAALIPDALFTAFGDGGREIKTADLIAAAKTVVPLSRTADKKIGDLRAWAQGRARPASEPQKTTVKAARVLDIA